VSLRHNPFPRDALNRLLSVLGSLRLAAALIVLLAVSAAVGGIVPQAATTPNADLIYRSYGIFWYRLITRLSLDDVFHSPWFFALTGLFALNLVLCTSRRARKTLASLFGEPRMMILSEADSRTIAMSSEKRVRCTLQRVAEIVRRAGYRRIVRLDCAGSPPQLVGLRRRWGALGADIVHLGILVILLGALLGAFRAEGTLRIDETEKGQLLPACGMEEQTENCLAFDLKVDDFGVETHGETGRVKDYWATISVWQEDHLLREARISVNRPVTIQGFGLYVWRYGADLQSALVRLRIIDPARNMVTAEIESRVGETAPVPGKQLLLKPLQYYRSFALDATGNPVDLGSTPGGQPAVLLQVTGTDSTGEETTYRDLALPFLSETNAKAEVSFLLAEASVPAYIDLHYVRNPGYPTFWWGFVVVMVGLAIAFYARPSSIRITMEPGRLLLRAEGRGGSRRAEQLAADLATLLLDSQPTEAEE